MTKLPLLAGSDQGREFNMATLRYINHKCPAAATNTTTTTTNNNNK
jgi:hypothetical protein